MFSRPRFNIRRFDILQSEHSQLSVSFNRLLRFSPVVGEITCQENGHRHRIDLYGTSEASEYTVWYSVLVLRVLFATIRELGYVSSESQVFSRVF
jgi:hypothetical protein